MTRSSVWVMLWVLSYSVAQAQYSAAIPEEEYQSQAKVVTDSVVWRTTAVLEDGDSTCRHEWVESGIWYIRYSMGSPIEYFKGRICRDCYRKERLKKFIYQHREDLPLTEYEKLDRELRERKRSQDTIQ